MALRRFNPPKQLRDYVDAAEYNSIIRDAYERLREDDERASSRTSPFSAALLPSAYWRIESHVGPYGREIEERVMIAVSNLEISEDTERNRWGDVLRYAQWRHRGLNPPPISVIQTAHGRLKTLDHRRLLAAKVVGAKHIDAWVSWCTLSPSGTEVGMTYELAMKGHQPLTVVEARPEYAIGANGAKAIEWAREHFNEDEA